MPVTSASTAIASGTSSTSSGSLPSISDLLPRPFAALAGLAQTPSKAEASGASGLMQRVRSSLGGLSALFTDGSKTRKRKVGKQRPSCMPPTIRKSLGLSRKSLVKPRHRKVGKQRPSVAPAALTSKAGVAEALPKHSGKKSESNTGQQRLQEVVPPSARAKILAKNEKLMPPPALPSILKPSRGSANSGAEKRKRSSKQSSILTRVPLREAKKEEDNYELSDLEEDKDGNRIEPDRSGKQVPAWSLNFLELATSQGGIDPDSIFGSRVPKLDLEEIFPDSFYRGFNPVKRRRGSSSHWVRDALTNQEIVAYTSKMGQKRRWSSLQAIRKASKTRTSQQSAAETKPAA